MADIVTLEVKDHIGFVTFNRPEKYNALSHEMIRKIIETGEKVMEDKSIRVVVLSGNGKGFCAGLDMENFQKMADGDDKLELFARAYNTPANKAQQVGWVWKQVPVPVIAALHGVAFGGGLQIALGADIRLAAPGTRFSVMEIKWGLIPDMSITQTLCDLVRLDVAKELTFTGRIVEAKEAAELGLITRVVEDPLAEATEMAKLIASKNPDAISRDKQLLESAWRAGAAKGMLIEESLQREIIATPNQIEAVMAEFEKRDPKFSDRF
ncbi:crotonase/enoyl-CoA hydratase family protein [Desulfatibacillum aliphaticivorans]|uniref:crotonase/enoyl-CoA hydratase family protein n=1 Tax=Desulfatibacillum aliphaticivorans TaxID=218208 RepID=UPI00040618EC|nr:crotonase/enoyl-CoA hydratase family protein [Desulfatibacillum aliphaticivorans]